MILRVVRGRIRPGERDDVLAAMRSEYGPILARTAGLIRFVLGIQPGAPDGDRFGAMSIWESLDAVHAAYGGDLSVPRTIDGRDRGAIPETVGYYELEAGRTPAGMAEPRLLRVTAGVVSRGMDADLQAALRSRLPNLPAEAVEAYVGRRVIASSVEIAFVSTWTEPPAGLSLDAPIWPDISSRYETFGLELHDVALVGDGAARVGSR